MGALFGTDGIRGRVGSYPLDAATLMRLGAVLGADHRDVFICWDTRESSSIIYDALASGIAQVGGNAVPGGVLPTPAAAILVRRHGFDAAISISASHNPYEDNGIKIFGPGGMKLPDEVEGAIEAKLAALPEIAPDGACGSSPSHKSVTGYLDDYVETLRAWLLPVRPLTIVIDCANGASAEPARRLFGPLGAVIINDSPDGKNINDACGSLHPEGLQRRVVEAGADIGVALDGDGDRAVFVDETGRVRDGDYTLLLLARDLQCRRLLASNTVVTTVMANMGLEMEMNRMGIRVVKVPVGDRYVLAEMMRTGAILGGEQSGHTIRLDLGPTGDGLITTIVVTNILSASSGTLSELCQPLQKFPQVLLNVPVRAKVDFDELEDVREAVESIERQLEGRGRLLLRYSGTEMFARIMIEGPEYDEIKSLADDVAGRIRVRIGIDGGSR